MKELSNKILSAAPLDDTCVLYMDFNDNGLDCIDKSKYHNNGTATGVTKTIGVNGEALQFNFAPSKVDCGNDASVNFGSGDLTFECWYKVPDLTDYRPLIVKWHNSLDLGIGMSANTHEANITCIGAGGGITAMYIANKVIANKWQCMVATRKGNDFKLCVDGKLVGTWTSSEMGDIDVGDNLYLGYDINAPYYSDGIISEVRIYKRVLPLNEIKDHYDLFSR